ncbi:transmembrane amino acid transporter protein-domain-containing protein [Polychytrium aggregatum]|uniref:transmembrane amino acid transporter protein-domain-containing protein n=1 Tax=Polychytrium aggregatum TaxID=110093 RepID=UPI0022FE289D|nr:transmembrane amino acid transporter protein-domain-containing protein [Polychytrium aggregatum]KAI9206867.1 transmembrane amino acid transporter protein-domain-containing protein [Polychytrium aggregatum]
MPSEADPLLPPQLPADDWVEEGVPASHPASRSGVGQTVTEALYHIVCIIAGSGVLQLPFSLNQAGWVGLFFVVFAGIANHYSGILLVKSLYYNGSVRLKSYPHVGYAAFGSVGKRLVELLNSVMLLGVTCVYLILAGMNLELLLGIYSTKTWIILCGLIVGIPFLYFRTLKEIAIFSAFGVFATILVIGVVLWHSVGDYPVYEGRVTHKVFDFSMLPSALGSISFSYSGNYVYPEVEASMREPEKFPRVLTLAMSVITAMYIVTGAVGYLTYGNLTVSPILNNLPKGFLSTFAIAVISAHVLLACPVMLTTFALETERHLKVDELELSSSQKSTRIALIRGGILAGVTVVSIIIPFFADFMTLLGAVANTFLIFVFPILFDFRLYGFWNRSWGEIIFGISIILLGVFGGTVGGFEAVKALWNDFINSR